jgi:hypothetical protein
MLFSQDERTTLHAGFHSLPSLQHQASVFPGDAHGCGSFTKRHRKRRAETWCELPLFAGLGLSTVAAKFCIGFPKGKPRQQRQIEISAKAWKKRPLKLLVYA